MKLFDMAHQAKESSSLWLIKLKQVVELTLTYARKVNSSGDFNYLNTLPPFQIRSKSVPNPIHK